MVEAKRRVWRSMQQQGLADCTGPKAARTLETLIELRGGRSLPRGALTRRGVETIASSRERNSTDAGCDSIPRRSQCNPNAVYYHPEADCPHPSGTSRHVVFEQSAL
jgi:hypothetical protein